MLAFLRKYDAAPDQLDTQALTDALLAAMQRGLRGEPGGLPMLPAYLAPGKHLPDTEGKRVAVVDAGGTHFRVATVRYEFGHPILENERKLPMPGTDGAADWTDFIRLTADALAPLLADAHAHRHLLQLSCTEHAGAGREGAQHDQGSAAHRLGGASRGR